MERIKRSYFIVVLLELIAINLSAQELPALPKPCVMISGGTNWCDTTSYKLVFYDEFTGYLDKSGSYPGVYHPLALDADKWYIPDDTLGTLPAVISAAYVVPNDGIGNCIMNVEKVSRAVPGTDTFNNFYYTGELGSTGPGGEYFKKGKFEACISMPGFYFSHSNMFLVDWGTAKSGAHIDISACEAYGDPLGICLPHPGWSGNRHIEGSTANWWSINGVTPPEMGAPPYFSNRRFGTVWPSASYFYFAGLFNSYHIYTFEWDDNRLTWSIDGDIVRQVERWHKRTFDGPAYTGCMPPPGEYQEDPAFPDATYGFPVHIIFHTWPDKSEDDSHISKHLGEMKIAWIRVYQKHPDEWHHDLCDRKLSATEQNINGIPTLKVALTGAGAVSTGDSVKWTMSSNLSIVELPGNPSWTNIVVRKTGADSTGWVRYSDNNPVCPSVTNYRTH